MAMNKYKKEIRQMFLLSIEKDVTKWSTSDHEDYYSPKYNNYELSIDNNWSECYLYLCQDSGAGNNKREIILKYRFFILIFDYKVWKSVRRMRKYFLNLEKEKKLEKQNTFLISALSEIRKSYIKEVRKEKLDKLSE